MERWSKKISETNNGGVIRLCKFGLLLVFLPTVAAQQSSPKTAGNNNQTAGTNSGIMIQLNVTAPPGVKRTLKSAAKQDLGDERGWLRVLTPAQDPTPPNSCGNLTSDAKSLTVILGGGMVSGYHRDACEIFRDNRPGVNTTDLLSVRRKGTSLVVSGVVFDDQGKVVVALKDNQPHVNKNNAFDWTRPDPHTLDVVNQKNERVLHIRLLNRTTVYVEGLFYDSRGTKLLVAPDRFAMTDPQTRGVTNMTGYCVFDAGRAVFSF